MHLAILTQYYRPEIGAPQARLSNLAQHFVRRGHSVTVLTAMPNYPLGRIYPGYGGFLRREMREGVSVIRTPIYPTTKTRILQRLTSYFSFVISSSLFGALLLKRPDYLLVESPPLFLGLAGLWLSRWKGARLIFNVSDLWPESALHLDVIKKNSLSHRLAQWLERLCYRNSWLITGQSRGILENIVQRFPESNTFHLSNGVDVSSFVMSCGDTANNDPKKNSLVVLYAGLHGIAQGLDQLIDAAHALRSENGFQFTFVGDGPEKKRLVQRADELQLTNIKFRDPVAPEKIPAILAAADVLIVPLKLHLPGAVPSKLYEAMASGRPIIAVAEGEPAEIVLTHRAGIVVTPGDLTGLTQALLKLRDKPSLRSELGQHGRKAAHRYDRKTIADRFISYLELDLAAHPVSTRLLRHSARSR